MVIRESQVSAPASAALPLSLRGRTASRRRRCRASTPARTAVFFVAAIGEVALTVKGDEERMMGRRRRSSYRLESQEMRRSLYTKPWDCFEYCFGFGR